MIHRLPCYKRYLSAALSFHCARYWQLSICCSRRSSSSRRSDMNTAQIDGILGRNSSTKQSYVGCFACDEIPSPPKYPAAWVVNLDPSTMPGSHWVALYSPCPGVVLYFDSLGDECPPTIHKFFDDNFLVMSRQQHQIQSNDSKVCGQYAMFFIFLCCNRWKYSDIEALLLKTKNPDLYVDFFTRKYIVNR